MPKASEWPAGLKRTKPRRRVLEVLKSAEQPLSAMDIAIEIEKSGGGASLSTVYRVLESFEAHRIAVKIAVMNSDTALYELDRRQHRHYAVCVDCRRIIPMDDCPVARFAPQLAEDGFVITGHNLEVFGHCKNCTGRPGG
jgi:Fur family ferric uptake transcriptional regulator